MHNLQRLRRSISGLSKDISPSLSLGAWNFSVLQLTMCLENCLEFRIASWHHGTVSLHLQTFLSPPSLSLSISMFFHFYVIQTCQVNTGITSEQNVKVVLMVGDQLGQNLTLQFVVSHALDPGQELISSYFTGLDNEAPELAHGCSRNKECFFGGPERGEKSCSI